MIKNRWKIFLSEMLVRIFLISFYLGAFAQMLEAQPDYMLKLKCFTSLEKALEMPDSVVCLKLRRNGLTEFPNEIFKFKNLRQLDLGNNKISSIPANIGDLEKLEVLNLERNKFVMLSKSIGDLHALRYLDLGMNAVQALPFEIGELRNLEFLQIWANEVTALPRSMEKLHKLRWLDMRTILLTASEREEIIDMFPDATILLSPDCNCGR